MYYYWALLLYAAVVLTKAQPFNYYNQLSLYDEDSSLTIEKVIKCTHYLTNIFNADKRLRHATTGEMVETLQRIILKADDNSNVCEFVLTYYPDRASYESEVRGSDDLLRVLMDDTRSKNFKYEGPTSRGFKQSRSNLMKKGCKGKSCKPPPEGMPPPERIKRQEGVTPPIVTELPPLPEEELPEGVTPPIVTELPPLPEEQLPEGVTPPTVTELPPLPEEELPEGVTPPIVTELPPLPEEQLPGGVTPSISI